MGLIEHLGHEWVMLANLLGLLLGFALLARHFEDSHIPQILPRFLPAGWLGGMTLLVMIFLLSGFLDNIAAALIGGAVAGGIYRYRVHIGYLAAIVAAANAGGAGSVVGDTTTTMMWISGIAPLDVLHASVLGRGLVGVRHPGLRRATALFGGGAGCACRGARGLDTSGHRARNPGRHGLHQCPG